MLNIDEKKEALLEIQKALYGDYVKNLSVYTFLTIKHKGELDENIVELSKKIGEARKRGEEISMREIEEERKEEEKRKEELEKIEKADGEKVEKVAREEKKISKELSESAVEVANLESRIDYVEQARNTIKKSRDRVNEVVKHYEKVESWIKEGLDVKEV